ncbi:DNA-directed RNA polymerase III subunit RPC3 isoform X1 [Phoenix dactylifera]|uniref:DNA-directed RNA polymerase III subunit RPC3 n=1 Tax=Phoenix dactylifera TaxID=42345 RepID=A0A8B7C701_PHODC|nr:DNA-directed RNA polymerase III subunit RPC3 isoform X1 [Phoenix dactylifera]
MAAQCGLKLAVSLITAHFGDLVAKVCSCLLHRGTLSLQEIIRFTELSSSQIKNCLLVLVQHNCVQAFSTPRPAGPGGVAKAVTQYMALFDNILHRMRFAKFLAVVRDDLGPQCEILLAGLLQNGRLTFGQLVERATSSKPEVSASMREGLRANFNRLVSARYVERCPRPEPFIEPSPQEETRSTRRRSAKTSEEILSIEQRAMVAAALSDAERFSEITDTATETIEVKATDHSSDVSVGDKRKYGALEMDQEVQAAITQNEVLWQANFEKFLLCLKKKACVAHVRSRFGLDAGAVLEAMIESSGQQKAKDETPVRATMDSILEGVRAKPGGISMTLEHIRVILDQLHCQSCNWGAGASYSIDLKSIIDTCQNDEVEALVLTRFGKEAYRIFRLLIKNGHPFETDRIADIAFVEKKDAQGILYKLWKDEYLDMEKVVSYAAGQKELFLWKVKKDALWEHVLNDLYHAALNLSQKIAHIVEQEHEVSQRREKPEQLRNGRMILELSLLKLDDALMLFRDF